ncbi:hypothetical protein NHL50_09440 [Acidimicrobiia bacterium EGI L10123]|uniref:hypothetical protein n=1 Tax=Salinilacustrithrix flava TaxID=2957203 RepID=UPI003D7C1DF7|nr:hypothetical protein [Acidimicrobiia bacterium EGI L10123]
MGRLRSVLAPLRCRFDQVDPSARLGARAVRRATLPPTTVVSVYRRRNADTLLDLLRPVAAREGVHVRLWALDDEAPELTRWTTGAGPGGRFELLNRLLAEAPAGYVALVDDDVSFTKGDLATFMKLVDHLGFDLAQPGHSVNSSRGHNFTTIEPLSIARRTTFIEIGPIVAIAPSIRPAIQPFPGRTPMGWGVDVEWSDLARNGDRRFGIIDATPIRHADRPGGGYSDDSQDHERRAVQDALNVRGLSAVTDVQAAIDMVRPWRVRPTR